MTEAPVSVVVLTHNRSAELMRCLQRLQALPGRPAVVVVDNASSDGSAALVRQRFPEVELVRCERNRGAAGRNAGVAQVRTRHVAFCDDDTFWAPGALQRASALLDAHPRLALVNARVLVGPQQRLDPACARMAASPLDGDHDRLPGPALISFMAGAVVMRSAAYREVGGYEERLFLGAEEALMALDLAARGWRMAYVPQVVTHHHPSTASRDPTARRIAVGRNRLWIAWMRLPWMGAWRETLQASREMAAQGVLGVAWRQALAGLPWALRRRRVVPAEVARMRRAVFG